MNFQLFSKEKQDNRPLWLDLSLLSIFILVGTLSRVIFVSGGLQPFPNFELIMVITFVSLFLIRPWLVFLVPLLSMMLSDLVLGNPVFIGASMNKIVLFTYTGFLVASFLFLKTRKKSQMSLSQITLKSVGLCIGVGMMSTLVYDLWTNTGWWYLMYPHTFESLISVFMAGIPFMIYHQLSTIFSFLTIAIPVGYLVTKKINLTIPTKQITFEKIPFISVTALLILLSFMGPTMAAPNNSDIWLDDSPETSIIINVQGSSWKITDQFILTEQLSALDALKLVSKKHDFVVETVFDETLDATLITSIHTDTNGDNACYWQYLVNGEAPMTGADNTFVSNGDSITWYYSQFS